MSSSDSQCTKASPSYHSSGPRGDHGPINETSSRLRAQTADAVWDCYRPPEFYVDPEAGAAFLCMHPKTLMRLARQGVVPAYSYNDGSRRRWRFLLSELDKWMKAKVNSTAHSVRPRPAHERGK